MQKIGSVILFWIDHLKLKYCMIAFKSDCRGIDANMLRDDTNYSIHKFYNENLEEKADRKWKAIPNTVYFSFTFVPTLSRNQKVEGVLLNEKLASTSTDTDKSLTTLQTSSNQTYQQPPLEYTIKASFTHFPTLRKVQHIIITPAADHIDWL